MGIIRVTFLFALTFLTLSSSFATEFTSEHWYGRRYHAKMTGEIFDGDDAKFRQFILSEIRKGHLLSAIQLNSIGGKTYPSLQIGAEIRLLELNTIAPTREGDRQYVTTGGLDRSYKEYPAECASSCFLIWSSGVGRLGDYVGMHHPYRSKDYYEKVDASDAERHYQETTRRVTAYLQEMDVPDYITKKMFRYMSYEIYYLNNEELESMRNSPPWLDELVYNRCGKQVPGNINPSSPNFNPTRKKIAECQGKIFDERLKNTHQRYLDRFGKPEEKVPDTVEPAPAPSAPPPAAPQVSRPAPEPEPIPASPPRVKVVSLDGPNLDYIIRDNRDLDGADIRPFIKDVNQDECARRCTSTSECVGFSFDLWNSLCIMKSRVTNSRLEPRSISGVVKRNFSSFPAALDIPPKMQRYDNAAFYGDGYMKVQMPDTNACANYCMSSRACVTFSYYKGQGTCRIYNSSGPFHRGEAGVDSGVKTQSP